MARPVFLVGSAPFEPEQTLDYFGTKIGSLAKRMPDGEQYGWLPIGIFETTEGLVPGRDEPIQDTGPTAVRQTLRLADGVEADDLRFETLHYASAAKDSYALFKRMRDDGRIPAGTRFQQSIPSPFTACLILDYDVVRDVWPVYERRLLENVAELLDAIPHEDLAISWDVVCEFTLLTAPTTRDQYGVEEMATAIARMVDAVPEDVETGLHFCYGRSNSKGDIEFASEEERRMLAPTIREISDTELMVRFFTAIHDAAHRPINWLHMPVPRKHDDDEFYAPLGKLPLDGVTELYLGLLHLDDGIEGTRRKLEAAKRAGVPFGVAAPCGFRASTTQMPESIRGLTPDLAVDMIDYHREVAELEA